MDLPHAPGGLREPGRQPGEGDRRCGPGGRALGRRGRLELGGPPRAGQRPLLPALHPGDPRDRRGCRRLLQERRPFRLLRVEKGHTRVPEGLRGRHLRRDHPPAGEDRHRRDAPYAPGRAGHGPGDGRDRRNGAFRLRHGRDGRLLEAPGDPGHRGGRGLPHDPGRGPVHPGPGPVLRDPRAFRHHADLRGLPAFRGGPADLCAGRAFHPRHLEDDPHHAAIPVGA